MPYTLNNRSRPFKIVGQSPITSIIISFKLIPSSIKVRPAQGVYDAADGFTLAPISAKYPNLALVRWVGVDGYVKGEEQRVDFIKIELYPPSPDCTGFEIYTPTGALFDVQILGGDNVFVPENYYLKSEVDTLLALRRLASDSYTKTEINAALLNSEENAIVAAYNASLDTYASDRRFIRYYGSSVPSSPVNAEKWRETDGSDNIIMDWNYNGSLSKWQSITEHTLGLSVDNAAASGVVRFVGTASNGVHSVRLTRLMNEYSIQTTNSTGNTWTYQLQAFGGGVFYGSAISGAGKGVGTNIKENQNLSNLILLSSAQSFTLNLVKSGTAGNYYGSHTVRYRYER